MKKSSPNNEYDRYLFHQGTHFHSYKIFGAHCVCKNGQVGVQFSTWAPNAQQVKVVGDFNNWNGNSHLMKKVNDSGIWVLFIPDLQEGKSYKYQIVGADGQNILKADPYGFYAEVRPKSASIVYELEGYNWQDDYWQNNKDINHYREPMLIYELHLGSWKQKEPGEFLNYRELADQLIDYVVKMGYTHVELLPIVEHPFDGSWGYQATGYYAVTSRYGTPQDFKYFVDKAHQAGIGVILDWVPGHFCRDGHGLYMFDGAPTYEYNDLVRRENRGWGTVNFDLGKPEVQSFLISNAYFWFKEFHIDGLRVDAVANMLNLSHGRSEDEWEPNQYGGKEDLEGIAFLRKLNEAVFKEFPRALMIAEESSDWPLISHPTYLGGIGFNYKWNMGWMNDVLKYIEMDPIHRKWHHNLLTFSFVYAFSENFVLPLSHDEVVHEKKSLLDKMPGDYWQKFANLRLLLAYMIAHPGKKLTFMGQEFGQFIEWKYDESLDWHLLEYPMHNKMHQYVKSLNEFYKGESCLWEIDHNWQGFEWIDPDNYDQSIVSFMRKIEDKEDFVVIVLNFTPEVYYDYRIGVPRLGTYTEILNSDNEKYGGSGQDNYSELHAEETPWNNQPYSLQLKIPPLAAVYLKQSNTIK